MTTSWSRVARTRAAVAEPDPRILSVSKVKGKTRIEVLSSENGSWKGGRLAPSSCLPTADHPSGGGGPASPDPSDTLERVICPSCGEENPDRFRLCASRRGAHDAARGARYSGGPCTVVFTDLTDSTTLSERLDAVALRTVLETYFGAMQAALHRHGGTVEKYIGDAIMAVFGMPVAHEDDALRAVRAALEMLRPLGAINGKSSCGGASALRPRTGVNTGEVVSLATPPAPSGS